MAIQEALEAGVEPSKIERKLTKSGQDLTAYKDDTAQRQGRVETDWQRAQEDLEKKRAEWHGLKVGIEGKWGLQRADFEAKADYAPLGSLVTRGTAGYWHHAADGRLLFRPTKIAGTECDWVKHKDEYFWRCPTVCMRPAGDVWQYTLKARRSRTRVAYEPETSPQAEDFGRFDVPETIASFHHVLGMETLPVLRAAREDAGP
eukprot:TRINITY_DN17102_c0_g4_i2.p2 TRINITY_DN17102_c0_g4~~TRINITY_DN17102_c0_g4_i2.p2  ORF type:complete len:203 (+),score=56.62 TRINITY_DN17102_c0_g4_i2:110-718(+)